jgi:hypothetical protein
MSVDKLQNLLQKYSLLEYKTDNIKKCFLVSAA